MESLAWEPVQRWSSSHPDCSPTRPFSGSAEGLLPPTCRKLPFPEYLAILAAQLYLRLLIPRWQVSSRAAATGCRLGMGSPRVESKSKPRALWGSFPRILSSRHFSQMFTLRLCSLKVFPLGQWKYRPFSPKLSGLTLGSLPFISSPVAVPGV